MVAGGLFGAVVVAVGDRSTRWSRARQLQMLIVVHPGGGLEGRQRHGKHSTWFIAATSLRMCSGVNGVRASGGVGVRLSAA